MHVCDKSLFYDILSELGVDAQTTVIAYDNLQSQMASRFFWAASLYGFPEGQVKVLDGGLKNWVRLGLKTSQQPEEPIPANPAAALTSLQPRPDLLATADEISQSVGKNTCTLFDVRSPAEYQGLKNLNQYAPSLSSNHPVYYRFKSKFRYFLIPGVAVTFQARVIWSGLIFSIHRPTASCLPTSCVRC